VSVRPTQRLGELRAAISAAMLMPGVPGLMLPDGRVLYARDDSSSIADVLAPRSEERLFGEPTGVLPENSGVQAMRCGLFSQAAHLHLV